MAKLLARAGRLLSRNCRLVRADAPCKTACCGGQPSLCCMSDTRVDAFPIDARTYPARTAGRSDSPHVYCVTDYSYREITRESGYISSTNSPTRSYTHARDRTLILNGPNVGTSDAAHGVCSARIDVPVRENLVERWAYINYPPPAADYDFAATEDYCTAVFANVWPVEGWPHNGFSYPVNAVNGDNVILSLNENYDTTSVDPRNGEVLHETARTTVDWEASPTTFTAVWNQVKTSRRDLSQVLIGGGASTNHDESRTEIEIRITVNMRWGLNCDGTAGPTAGCTFVGPTPCNPGTIRYILGRACGPSPRPFVLPEIAVLSCGYAQSPDGTCYQFSPSGPRVTDPAAIGALIGTSIVDSSSPQTCCECGPNCTKTQLVPQPEWTGGYRDSGGFWRTTPAAASGNCCCSANDRFTLLRQFSEMKFYNQGSMYRRERFDFVAGPGGTTFVSGFRRDATDINYRLSFQAYDGSGVPIPGETFLQDVGVVGPVGCVWDGFSGGTINTEYSLLAPLRAQGTHPRFQQCPLPYELAPSSNGTNGTWWLMGFTTVVNCQALSQTARWVQFENGYGTRPVYDITAEAVWKIERIETAGDPCAGGCAGAATTPVAGTTPGNGPEGLPDLRTLLGGI